MILDSCMVWTVYLGENQFIGNSSISAQVSNYMSSLHRWEVCYHGGLDFLCVDIDSLCAKWRRSCQYTVHYFCKCQFGLCIIVGRNNWHKLQECSLPILSSQFQPFYHQKFLGWLLGMPHAPCSVYHCISIPVAH